jgi:phosphatidylglycerol:prolipoprotein diacylglycerol transferase
MIHPQPDPVAFTLGPLTMSWYGLMYLAAFFSSWRLAHVHLRRQPVCPPRQINEAAFYVFLGVGLGGRLGYVLLYNPAYYLAHPWAVFAFSEGGMSFHGGFFGVIFALIYVVWKLRREWWVATDFIAPIIPLALMFGRIGNFINGELWGRVADPALPWAMVFPKADALARHPAQLYHAALEGLALFVILWIFSGKPRPKGAVSGVFLLGYGAFRFIVEFFRAPDKGIFAASYGIEWGAWLAVSLIVASLALIWYADRTRRWFLAIPGMFFLGYGVLRALIELTRAFSGGGVVLEEDSILTMGQCLSLLMMALSVVPLWTAYTSNRAAAARVEAILNPNFGPAAQPSRDAT